tara:strand:- start:825 stop:1154 length:330 start_codon:yes stop_codon:yes gene_type:complete
MGSWIIVATFIATALYLIIRSRNFNLLPLLASVATAILLCFFGLLFIAVINALLAKISSPVEDPTGQALLVSLGVLLGLTTRHYWKQWVASKPSAKPASKRPSNKSSSE